VIPSCDVDFPEVQGDSVKLEFKWEMGDADATEYNVVAPEFQFLAAGPYEVNVSVFYPAWAVVRQQTLNFNVTDP